MDRPTLETRVENFDRRLERVEQILPTLATKDDLKAFPTKEDVKVFLTKEDAKVFLTRKDAKVFATKADLAQYAVEQRAYLHGEFRRAILHDMRVLFEEQQHFIRVLAEGIQRCNERLARVDAESRSRDAHLDGRLQRLERRP
jgi:hypothetical protein